MAPDLNTVPPSTRPQHDQNGPSTTTSANAPPQPRRTSSSTTTSRRASQIFPMSPPPLPLASPGAGTGSTSTTVSPGHNHQSGFPPLSPHIGGSGSSSRQQDNEPGVPMRHPRPLTAAELHLELEQEQEAVVNRLTRELSALRAHSASVASTATTASMSSTSTGAPGLNAQHQAHPFLFEATDPSQAHAGALTGPTHPARQRSESSVSRGSVSGATVERGSVTLPHRYSVSGQPYQQHLQNQHIGQHQYQHGAGDGGWLSNATGMGTGASARSPGSRFEEVALHKVELEEAKRENEGLRKKIRELEAELRGRRGSSAASSVQQRE